MTQRWKLTIEYDGSGFAGWQLQDGPLTVQECVEKAVFGFSGETVRCHVAGRTDAGVHAVGQVAHIDLEKEFEDRAVRDAINFHLRPHPVAVVKAEAVSLDFHARFGAQKRHYCYKIIMGRRPEPVLFHQRAWHVKHDLDLDAMNAAARHLLGTHDFSSFRAAECQAKTPIRSLDRLEISEQKNTPGAGRHIEIWAEAKSFLHHQIRNIAGSLVLVGKGKWNPDDMKTVLEARDRTKAGPMAPAGGLYFVQVDYA
jgi:tRNA pseudouridine38-40 synthase